MTVTGLGAIIPFPHIAHAKCVDPAREPEALEHLRAGNELYDQAAFDPALREYREAYAICKSEKLFFSIGNCEAKLGRPAEAATDFERFLRNAPDAESELRDNALGKLKNLATALVVVEVRGAHAGARIRIDEGPEEGLVQAAPLYLAPGAHRVRVKSATALPFEQMIRGTPGAQLLVDVVSARLPPLPPAADDGEHRLTHRWWFWTALGTVVVAGAIAGYAFTRSDRPPCQSPIICP